MKVVDIKRTERETENSKAEDKIKAFKMQIASKIKAQMIHAITPF